MTSKRRTYTLEQIERRQAKAVTGARNLGLYDVAADLESMTPSEFAEHKNLIVENPRRKGVISMPRKSREELMDEVADLRDEVEEWKTKAEGYEEKLDQISDIASEEVESEPESNDDDDD